MSVNDVLHTRKIVHLQIHVERAIGRAKQHRILQHILPASMWDSVNKLVYVCFMLTNFSPPFGGIELLITIIDSCTYIKMGWIVKI